MFGDCFGWLFFSLIHNSFLRRYGKMKKGISDIVSKLSGYGDVPDYEIKSISNDGDTITIIVAGVKDECTKCKCVDSENKEPE